MWRGGAGGFLLRTSERTSPSDPRGPRAWEKWVSGSGWALGVNGGARGGRSRPGPRAGLHLGALPPAGPRPLPPPGPSPRPAGTRHSPAPTQPAGSGGSSSATPAKRGPHEGSACARPARGGGGEGRVPTEAESRDPGCGHGSRGLPAPGREGQREGGSCDRARRRGTRTSRTRGGGGGDAGAPGRGPAANALSVRRRRAGCKTSPTRSRWATPGGG